MKNTKKVAILVPYFGKFPNYFELWLDSCKKNDQIDWFIITDNRQAGNGSAPNIHWIESSLKALKQKFESKLGTPCSLDHPYKICDYRPAFGFLFSELVQDHNWWGYCDTDMIFGDICHFIGEKLTTSEFDRIYQRGALTIWRNSDSVNNLFRTTGAYVRSFQECISLSVHTGFDEWRGINQICVANHVATYLENDMADIKFRPRRLLMNRRANHKHQTFIYENGRLQHIWEEKTGIRRHTALAYIHLQKRHLDYNVASLSNPIQIDGLEIRNTQLADTKVPKAYNEPFIRWLRRRFRMQIKRINNAIARRREGLSARF